jgi:CDP-6-deoxy-D-xylo-4-hexulose-3-dehydrase
MIKLIKSTFYNEKETKKSLCEFISKAQQLSIGNQCYEFEKNFAKWQGRKYCVFFNSGSSANLALIQTLLNLELIRKGDQAGFSAITWATNPMPMLQLGIKAIPVDVELDTLNVSSRTLKQFLESYELKLLFITNLLGFCDDIDEIRKICHKKNIILIEDNCESLGTIYKNQKLGNFGLASTFSFFVGHHMSTIEGGAVCTDDEDVAVMLKLVRAHGWDRNLEEKTQKNLRSKHNVNSAFYSKYTFYDLGFNLRPTEINGFLGNNQLKYLDNIVDKRESNFLKFATNINKRKDLYFTTKYDHIDKISNFAYPVICKSKKTRDNLINSCEGILEIRPIVGGDMTHQPFYKKYMPQYEKSLGNSNANVIQEQGLYFGNNPDMTSKEIKTIIKIFTEEC